MKKFLAVFSLLMLVLLTGCLSDKTERDLTQVPTTEGGTNYSFKNSGISQTTTEVTGSFMTFKYKTGNVTYTSEGGTSFVLTPVGEVFPYTNIKSVEGTTIDLNDELTSLVQATVPQGVATKKIEGAIAFSNNKYNGTYQKGEITKDTQKLYYYMAKVNVSLLENGVTKNYVYLIKTVVPNDTAIELISFEDAVRSITPRVSEETVDLTKQTELIKHLKTLSSTSNYSNETLKQEIYKAIDDFYIYVEGAYVDSSVSSSAKRAAAVEYTEKNSFDYVESSTNTVKVADMHEMITKLLENAQMSYRDDLEGEIATAEKYYMADEKGEKRLITNLSSLELKLNLLIESKIKEDSLQGYIYNKEFWKKVVISELRSDSLFKTAIKYIILGNCEDLRVNKLGEEKYPVTAGVQPLTGYEEQLKKLTAYASYEFYKQTYFLPKNDKVEKQLNIEDYLLIKGAESLADNNGLLGKTEFVKDTKTQRYVKEIFEKAYKNVIKKKMEILSINNADYFNKVETADANGTLNSLKLTYVRNNINEALENLVNSVKIYDTSNIFVGGLTLDSLTTSETYKLTFETVTDKIKNIATPIDYKKTVFAIPLISGNIDLEALANNIEADSSNLRTEAGVYTALEILNHNEN